MGPTRPWRVRARLVAWYAVCAALLLGHAGWFIAMRWVWAPAKPQVVLLGGAALASLIVLLALMLATTPPDAIRLPRGRSEAIIFLGAIFLELMAFFAVPVPAYRVAVPALAVLCITLALLLISRATNRSAWITALFAWNPLVIYQTAIKGQATGWPAVVMLVLLSVLILAMLRRRIFPFLRMHP